MRDLVQVEVPVLGEAATHLFAGSNSGGKKIRATMVLLTARAFRKGRGRSFRQRKLAEIIEIIPNIILENDLILTLGAGDVNKIPHQLKEHFCK